MVVVKTSVPATKATPSSTASIVIISLALCASTLRRAVRNMAVRNMGGASRCRRGGESVSAAAGRGVEATHAVQDQLGCGVAQLVDDAAVDQEDHAVGV